MRWLADGGISIDPPKRTKKITGTRFGAVLGKNVWNTPFKVWCEVTKTYEEPFEGSIYTEAGKVIEPKQIEYMSLLSVDDVVTPTDVYGKDYFSKTYGDFYPEQKIFGGMWDALTVDDNGDYSGVIECKTTKRAEDWQEDIPEYYALQGALYARLLNVDTVHMVCSILTDKDYVSPDLFKPNATNTFVRTFRVSERYPDFDEMMDECVAWWNKYVKSGNSPIPSNKDAQILKELKKTVVTVDDDIKDLLNEWENLKEWLDNEKARLETNQKRFDAISKEIKNRYAKGDGEVTVEGNKYTIRYVPSQRKSADISALEDAGLNEYIKYTDSYTMRVEEKEI